MEDCFMSIFYGRFLLFMLIRILFILYMTRALGRPLYDWNFCNFSILSYIRACMLVYLLWLSSHLVWQAPSDSVTLSLNSLIFLLFSSLIFTCFQAFIDFRCSVVERRARYKLSQAQQRQHIVEVYNLCVCIVSTNLLTTYVGRRVWKLFIYFFHMGKI